MTCRWLSSPCVFTSSSLGACVSPSVLIRTPCFTVIISLKALSTNSHVQRCWIMNLGQQEVTEAIPLPSDRNISEPSWVKESWSAF